MECDTHTGEKVFMVCISCDKFPFACGNCLEEKHVKHEVQTLRNAAHSILQNLEKVETENVRVFKEIKSDLEGLTEIREDLKQDANNVDDEIAKRVDVIRSKIDEVNTEVIQKHKTEVGKNAESIDRTEEALKKQVAQIKTFKKKVAQLQKMNDYVDVIESGREVKVPDTNRIPRPDIQALTFSPGTVRDGELKRMFGGINTMSSDFVGSIERESNIKVTPVTSFKLPKDDGIDTMFCSKPGHCWLKCKDKNTVKLLNTSGETLQAVKLETQTNGFTVTSNNRLLFCCATPQCVKKMNLPNGEITEKFSTSPLTPNYICTGPSGDIYVTLFDKNDYKLKKDSTRVLIQYNSRGLEKARCQTDVFGECLFVVPMDVFVNNKGTRVAVINEIRVNRSELVVLDQDLSPLFVYTGPSVLTGRSLSGFKINGATFDTRDNILVAEENSQTIQLLSPSCEPLKVLRAMEASPWTLSLHGNEVWVGYDEGEVDVFRYSY
ncbi:uncharacterized protein LOC110441420 [Mizuhopecten yessoensis]|uniref:uncharacterized protein LOC110441420 n=1 Tax=Mizuhopecten yessoensis TaxID=6573 RepID=UPI000B45F5D8|nr:uncharacterized protein LOC110441420 [Mizuhopecten yessoensis]